jgi:intracellular multiplication protein IcmK
MTKAALIKAFILAIPVLGCASFSVARAQEASPPPMLDVPTSAAPAAAAATEPPPFAAILEQAGVAPAPAQGEVEDAASAPPQSIPPTPGLDLPITGNLPAAAMDEGEMSDEELEQQLRKEAFKVATDSIMPLKPKEIRRMLELYDETKQAADTPVYPTPEPRSSFQTISLQPGTKPLVIKTAVGNVTTLSIVDITGQPWPIQDLSWAGEFEILQPESGGNMLRITPLAEFSAGNISMRLVGLNPPVIFSIATERKTVDVRLDVQIPELGPKSIAPPIEMPISTTAGDVKMTAVLEGVPPGASSRLKIDGIDGRTTAYELEGMMYVRTPYTLLSPAWSSAVRSADGTNVYALQFTPVLLLSDKGKMVRAYLNREEESDVQ